VSTGRRLVITADHHHVARVRFPDVVNWDQAKDPDDDQFKAGRRAAGDDQSAWVSPIDSVIESEHGRHRSVLGRREWKAQGGSPTRTHGGLSVLEVAVLFVELYQSNQAEKVA